MPRVDQGQEWAGQHRPTMEGLAARAQNLMDKGKDPISNPNPAITHDEEEELMMGGAVHPPIFTGKALGQPPTSEGGSRASQGGGPDGRNPRQDTPWAEFVRGGADHHGLSMWEPTDHIGGGPRGLEGGHGHLGPAEGQVSRGGPQGGYWRGTSGSTTIAAWTGGDNTAYERGENLPGRGISSHPMEEKGRGHQERLSTMNHGERGNRLKGRKLRGSGLTSSTRKEGSKGLTWRTLFCITREVMKMNKGSKEQSQGNL